jgi:hypothetical protein
MYENGKIRPVETIPEMRNEGSRIKENDGGVNSTMIYCKKCSPFSQMDAP